MDGMAVPSEVYQGINFVAEVDCTKYPSSDYTGKLTLSKAGESNIVITGNAASNGNAHEFSATAATTATWPAGAWSWTATAELGANAYLITTGTLTISALNGQTNALMDAKAALAEAEVELRAAQVRASSYSIKDRSLSRVSLNDLRGVVDYWRNRVKQLQAADDRACGRGNRSITYGAFRR